MHQSLTSLPSLTSIQLNDNHITGHLLEVTQSTLRFFNVSYNDLAGPIPNTSVLQSFGFSSYLGNPKLCGPPTPTPCSSKFELPSQEAKGKHKGLDFTTIFIIIDAALLLLVLLIVFFFCKRSKYLKPNTVSAKEVTTTDYIQTQDKTPEPQINHKLTFISDENQFELSDLLKASAEGLGSGNFGNTYKAVLHGGHSFVVKRMRDLKPMSVQEFERQIEFITDLQHPNLLPLVAFYSSINEKLIIHQHILGGNLFNRIQAGKRSSNRIPFRWSSRLSVARGVAKAIEYLHLNTKSPQAIIPHGNLKTTNILLDANNTPLVTDYGLTALISLPIATQRMISYKSPEYHQLVKKLTKDVWCLGIVLLEILTGRISIHSASAGMSGVDLCSWVHMAVREEWTAEVFDTEIASQRSAAKGMLSLLKIAMKCCEKSPEKRPEIGEVVVELESLRSATTEEEEYEIGDLSSTDRSLTDESYSTTASVSLDVK